MCISAKPRLDWWSCQGPSENVSYLIKILSGILERVCKYICVPFHEGSLGDGGGRTALPCVFFLESEEIESYSNVGVLDLEDVIKIRKSNTHLINVSIFFFFLEFEKNLARRVHTPQFGKRMPEILHRLLSALHRNAEVTG